MIKLILIRHAKSSWETTLNDVARPLSVRGINDAHLVSDALKEFLPKSFIVWSSSATRAYNTAVVFCQNLNIPLESIIQKDELYTFDSLALQEVIKSCDNSHQNLILFGHNDAITNFVNKFGEPTIESVPTSGVVIMEFEQEQWQHIKKGKISKELYPRDLKV